MKQNAFREQRIQAACRMGIHDFEKKKSTRYPEDKKNQLRSSKQIYTDRPWFLPCRVIVGTGQIVASELVLESSAS